MLRALLIAIAVLPLTVRSQAPARWYLQVRTLH
jgi:hypothetical protein